MGPTEAWVQEGWGPAQTWEECLGLSGRSPMREVWASCLVPWERLQDRKPCPLSRPRGPPPPRQAQAQLSGHLLCTFGEIPPTPS